MIQKYSCPSCAAELSFRSTASVYQTCSSCRSLVVRHGTDLEIIGEVSDVMDDLTVVQPRTKGRFQGRAFDVLGRLRVGWENGFWNEWAVESDGKICWLAEAQGYFVFFNRFADVTAPLPATFVAGQEYTAPDGVTYQVTDVKKAKVIGVEGEVPGQVELNQEYLSVDMQRSETEHATLDSRAGVNTFSFGMYQETKDFHFEYLRQIDGW